MKIIKTKNIKSSKDRISLHDANNLCHVTSVQIKLEFVFEKEKLYSKDFAALHSVVKI